MSAGRRSLPRAVRPHARRVSGCVRRASRHEREFDGQNLRQWTHVRICFPFGDGKISPEQQGDRLGQRSVFSERSVAQCARSVRSREMLTPRRPYLGRTGVGVGVRVSAILRTAKV